MTVLERPRHDTSSYNERLLWAVRDI